MRTSQGTMSANFAFTYVHSRMSIIFSTLANIKTVSHSSKDFSHTYSEWCCLKSRFQDLFYFSASCHLFFQIKVCPKCTWNYTSKLKRRRTIWNDVAVNDQKRWCTWKKIVGNSWQTFAIFLHLLISLTIPSIWIFTQHGNVLPIETTSCLV